MSADQAEKQTHQVTSDTDLVLASKPIPAGREVGVTRIASLGSPLGYVRDSERAVRESAEFKEWLDTITVDLRDPSSYSAREEASHYYNSPFRVPLLLFCNEIPFNDFSRFEAPKENKLAAKL